MMEFRIQEISVKKNKLFFIDFEAPYLLAIIKNNKSTTIEMPKIIIDPEIKSLSCREHLDSVQSSFWIWFSFICEDIGEYSFAITNQSRVECYIVTCND